MMKNAIWILVVFLIWSCASPEEPTGPVFVEKGYALSGYDPVAYFEQAEARQGTSDETLTYNGVIYAFSSTKNRKLFEENPEKYLPAYGGWCAYAVAERSTRMAPDPTKWQIQDGELQLFYDDWQTNLFGNLKDEWNQDPDSFKSRADVNWRKMN